MSPKSRNLAVRIRIEMVDCDEPVSDEHDGPEALGNGEFQLVLSGDKELDIDGLEQGLLRTSYPAIRQVLSDHMSEVLKKRS